MQPWHMCYDIVLCLCQSFLMDRSKAYLENIPCGQGYAPLEVAGAAQLYWRKFPRCLGVCDFLAAQRAILKS